MASIRIKLNTAEFNAFRKSAAVVDHLESVGNDMAARANAAVQHRSYPEEGDPFQVRTFYNRTRAVVMVVTGGFDGEVAEATDRALSRAVP